MFEARLQKAGIFKKLIDAMKDLVSEASVSCSASGMSLQAMDSSHVSLCSLSLKKDGFEQYRCDREVMLGLSLVNLGKILKCADGEDLMTLKHEGSTDVITFMFENKSQDKISDFEMKLMDIDSEHLGIPDTPYKARVKLPSGEFNKIMRDLSTIGDTCTINVNKSGIHFSVTGDVGTANISVKQNRAVDNEKDSCTIEMEEPVKLTFAIRYLVAFTKGTPLSDHVSLKLSPDVPLSVEYSMAEAGYLRYFLAPKLDDEAE